MEDNPIYYRNRLIQIFRDHWEQFKVFHPDLITQDIEDNVQKMMNCGSFKNGYAEYRCSCGEIKRVPFSCKSRFCLRCARVYIDNWVARVKEVLFTKVSHRHIILTVPGSLWSYFHDPAMLKFLADCGVEMVREVVSICKRGKEIELGIILVIQTSGRRSTWNPHLHLLVTEGGLDKEGRWYDVTYFDYTLLRKRWLYILLTRLKEALADEIGAVEKIEEVFQKRASQGLIARAKKEKVRKRDIVDYLVKYIASPPIALSRITSYDGETVEYWYREHPTNKQVSTQVSAFEFIRRLIQHIPAKGLKLIRYYGLYARCKIQKVRAIIERIFSNVKHIVQEFSELITRGIPNDYRRRLKESFGLDPLKCPKCGEEMVLFKIWHPKYGSIYDIFRDSPEIIVWEIKKDVVEEKKVEPTEKQFYFWPGLDQLFLSEV
jgi:hypothetical protein